MQTVILIDGTSNPGTYLVNESERAQDLGLTSQRGKPFKFVKMLGDCRIYRDPKLKLSDKEFDALAEAEADKFNNPEKYAALSGGQSAAEKELAAYKAKFGPLKGN